MSSPTESAARRAVRFARLSKALSWLAVLTGAGFVALFLVQAGLFGALMPEEPGLPTPVPNPDQITATDSTVTGMDKENQPYQVSAKRGWQDEATPNLVYLEVVEGEFRRASGAEYKVTANTGAYDTKIKELDLAGDVVIIEKERFTATMDKAHVVVEEKKLTSDVAVDVSFAGGTIKANGMQITDDGARILFLNGVKAQFGSAATKGDERP